jgi:hypothetical protein
MARCKPIAIIDDDALVMSQRDNWAEVDWQRSRRCLRLVVELEALNLFTGRGG